MNTEVKCAIIRIGLPVVRQGIRDAGRETRFLGASRNLGCFSAASPATLCAPTSLRYAVSSHCAFLHYSSVSGMANVTRMIDELAAIPGRIRELKCAAETDDRDISLKLRQIEPQICEIEGLRGKFAAATTSYWLPLEEEQRLGQLKSEQSRLQAEHAAIKPRTAAGIQTAEDARVALEQILRPLLKDYYVKKRSADEATLVLALDDAAKAVVGRLQGDPVEAMGISIHEPGASAIRCSTSTSC